MIKVGEVEDDRNLRYVYKIEDETVYYVLLNYDKTIQNSHNDISLLYRDDVIREIVPHNPLSRIVYPNSESTEYGLAVYPKGRKDEIEDFVKKCKEFIKEKRL